MFSMDYVRQRRIRLRRRLWTTVTILCFCTSGCGPPPNQEQLRSEVLKADPGFADVLKKRDELAGRIGLLERELALKKNQMDRQIEQLHKEFATARQQVAQKTQQTKALLMSDQQRVELALSMAAEELKAKRGQRASLGRSISRLRKALHQEGMQWTDVERTRMDTELAELLNETKRLDQELSSLHTHLHLLTIKRSLLRL